MKTTTNLHDFSNCNLYIGIDSHLKSWKVTIYSDEFELKTFSQDPIPEKLARYLKGNYPKANYQCVYEAGFSGYWAQRKLQEVQKENGPINL